MKYLIWSIEHQAWWGPDQWGYVGVPALAGRYELFEANEICQRANRYLPDGMIHEIKIPETALDLPDEF